MTWAEEQAFLVLRQADEPWLEMWVLAKRMGVHWRHAAVAVRGLRKRGLVVKRACSSGLSSVEVSLASGGVW